jgi:hypothetical protein
MDLKLAFWKNLWGGGRRMITSDKFLAETFNSRYWDFASASRPQILAFSVFALLQGFLRVQLTDYYENVV